MSDMARFESQPTTVLPTGRELVEEMDRESAERTNAVAARWIQVGGAFVPKGKPQSEGATR